MPDKEEDEGYLAGLGGQRVTGNPYARGTIRYLRWRHGWQLASQSSGEEERIGYEAAGNGLQRSDNPHPPGTIRFDGWRRGWDHHFYAMRRGMHTGTGQQEPDLATGPGEP